MFARFTMQHAVSTAVPLASTSMKYFAVEEADWGAEAEGSTFTANFQVYF